MFTKNYKSILLVRFKNIHFFPIKTINDAATPKYAASPQRICASYFPPVLLFCLHLFMHIVLIFSTVFFLSMFPFVFLEKRTSPQKLLLIVSHQSRLVLTRGNPPARMEVFRFVPIVSLPSPPDLSIFSTPFSFSPWVETK